MTKYCSACKTIKDIDDFARYARRPDGRQTQCRSCKSNTDKLYYFNNLESINATKSKRIKKNQVLLAQYLEKNPCVDCGERDILVLEFDHRDGSPVNRVTTIITSSWNSILKEIEKCDVRCSNCHTRITHKRANDWRWQYCAVGE